MKHCLFIALAILVCLTPDSFSEIVHGQPTVHSVMFFKPITGEESLIALPSAPNDLVYHRDDKILVAADDGNLYKIDSKGIESIFTYQNLTDIDFINNNTYLLTSRANNEIFFLDINTLTITAIHYQPNSPTDADLLEDYRFLITESNPSKVIMVSQEGDILLEYAENLKNPQDAILLPDQTILISDFDNHRLIQIDQDGNLLNEFLDFDHPRKLELTQSGEILVADSDHQTLKKITPNGEIITIRENLNRITSAKYDENTQTYICSIINGFYQQQTTQTPLKSTNLYANLVENLIHSLFIIAIVYLLGYFPLKRLVKHITLVRLNFIVINLLLIHSFYLLYHAATSIPYTPSWLLIFNLVFLFILLPKSNTSNFMGIVEKPIPLSIGYIVLAIVFTFIIAVCQFLYLQNQLHWVIPNLVWFTAIVILIVITSKHTDFRPTVTTFNFFGVHFAFPGSSENGLMANHTKAITNSLLLVLLLVSFLLYSLLLDQYPTDIHGDETSVALHGFNLFSNFDLNLFKPGWFSIPNLFFMGQGFMVYFFGMEIATLRMFSVVIGLLSILLFYKVANLLFDPFPSLIGTILFATSAYSIHFFRIATGFSESILMILICMYFFIRSILHKDILDFTLTSVFAGISIYTYQPCKLIFPLVVLSYVMIFIFVDRKYFWLKVILFSCVTYTVTISPILGNSYYSQTATFSRYNQVSLLTETGYSGIQQEYDEDDSFLEILAKQHVRAFHGIIAKPDQSPFIANTTYGGILNPLSATLLLVGVFICLITKNFILKIILLWTLLFTMIGSALTVSPPAYQRLAPAFPLLCLLTIPALSAYQNCLNTLTQKRRYTVLFIAFFVILLVGINFHKYFLTIMDEVQPVTSHSFLIKYLADLDDQEKVIMATSPHLKENYGTLNFLIPDNDFYHVTHFEEEINSINYYVQLRQATIILYRSNKQYLELVKDHFNVHTIKYITIPKTTDSFIVIEIN